MLGHQSISCKMRKWFLYSQVYQSTPREAALMDIEEWWVQMSSQEIHTNHTLTQQLVTLARTTLHWSLCNEAETCFWFSPNHFLQSFYSSLEGAMKLKFVSFRSF